MHITTDALVIRETNVGERDRLITVISREYGVISAYASGAKSIKSKKGAATSLLSYSSFILKHKGDTYRVEEASPIKIFYNAGSNVLTLSLAQYFCELSSVLGPRGTDSEEFLRLILNSLHFLTENKMNVNQVKAIAELRLMCLSGYSPSLLACEGCGKFEDGIMYFNIVNGSLICNECKKIDELIPLEKAVLDAMRHIVFAPFNRLYSFEINEASAKKLSAITEKYLIYQTERTYKTLEFYNSINII